MSVKVPFKVSARTARLIGRENVATAKGAIIELIKNGYDADGSVCVVFIDNYLSNFHEELTTNEYNILIQRGVSSCLLELVYTFNVEVNLYQKKQNVQIEQLEKLKLQLRSLTQIYIIDNGEGMTESIIRDYWMTIGTDNKATNFTSTGGRVKVGAKGIGRFALDKLGDDCEMITFYDAHAYEKKNDKELAEHFCGYHWTLNWNDFEGSAKTIDRVNATLEGIKENTFAEYIHSLGLRKDILENIEHHGLEHGTLLKISSPRDAWDDYAISQIYEDLGVLLPPSELNEFSILLYASNTPNDYGLVDSSVCDDYDYKLVAHADEHQNVKIRIYRNEYDLDSIPATFFQRDVQKRPPFTKEDFKRGYWDTNRTFRELCPGYDELDMDHSFNDVGKFDFTFYYMKRTTNSDEERRFFYRQCSYNVRKLWLDKYGGVKLFRDEFRVRPYGERQDSAFDWLGLGARKAKSPAGVAKLNGGYKVEPENIAGLISISRLNNINFDDKSSREGLQENKTFKILQKLIIGIISVFEDDRSQIAREFAADDQDRNGEARRREEASKLVEEIIKKNQEQKENGKGDNTEEEDRFILLAESNRQKDEELNSLREEQKMLRVLASSGLMLASFSHDLSKLNITLGSRYDKIEHLFEEKIDKAAFKHTDERNNPYLLLDKAKDTDIKIQSWLNFATGVIKKDKRKRRNIHISNYFNALNETWKTVFEARGIKLDLSEVEDIVMKVFEIDLDSIFHNLFSNSIEAFNIMKIDRPRKISIKTYHTSKSIILEYRDSAEGLSPDIVNPNDIFKPFFTTRRNPSTGEEIGTGLGMWIVKNVIKDNDAKLNLLSLDYGFGIRFIFPINYLGQ